jgi:mannosyl-3-phosphoglycerate phosphatase
LRVPLTIFTDLDGTLLDHVTYSFEPARPALDALAEAGVPVVLCTSKTRAETERWRAALANAHPFIVENGGAAFVPDGYFGPGTRFDKQEGGYGVLEFGRPYAELRRALASIRAATGLPLRGFGDMTVDEVAERCGFTREDAEMAGRREYDEPFVGVGPADLGAVLRAAQAEGLRIVSGGRFHHLVGESDKGRAVRALRALYEAAGGPVRAVGLGDSPNDEPMLRAVDVPVLVRRPGGGYYAAVHLPGLIVAPYSGPEGWREAVLEILDGLASGGPGPDQTSG